VLSDRLNVEAFAWLDQRPEDRPFFLYLHATDPHDPYTPRQPFLDRLESVPVGLPEEHASEFAPAKIYAGSDLESAGRHRVRTDDLIRLYDAEIAFNDEHFGALMDRLKEQSLYEDALIVVLSDHGEAFGDHPHVWKHGNSLYAEEIRVPLIVKLPGNHRAGTRIAEPVQQIDVFPTILQLAEIDVLDELQGRSLLETLDPGSAGSAPATYSYLDLDDRHIASTRSDGLCLIRNFPDSRIRPGTFELYDREHDPRERRNRYFDLPLEARYLRSLLDAAEIFWEREIAAEVELSDELEERLKALGYLE
jgi:arylsulfatase